MTPHRPRLESIRVKPTLTRMHGDCLLGTRDALAAFTNRSIATVRRYGIPVACDTKTRAGLYNLDAGVRQFKTVSGDKCIIPDDVDGDPCGSPAHHAAPWPLCVVHMGLIAEFFGQQDKVDLVRAALLRQQALEPPVRSNGELRDAVVYYVQVDALVKIGTSTNINVRMKAYPPHARLLATEPGGYTLESRRLRQFNEYLRYGNEWFDPGPRLREHIEKLMAESGVSV